MLWHILKSHFQTSLQLGHELHSAAMSTQGISSQEWFAQTGLSGIAIDSIQQTANPETLWLFLKDCFGVIVTQEKAFRKLSKLLPPTYVGSCSLLLLFILYLLFTHKCCSLKYSRTFFSSSVCCLLSRRRNVTTFLWRSLGHDGWNVTNN